MATHHEELLEVAERLLGRSSGERGKLSRARVRRSISTAYYALFHFLLREIGRQVVGSKSTLLERRRIVARTISHKAMKTALDRVRGVNVEKSVEDFIRLRDPARGLIASPDFARTLANVFDDAQQKRHDADYNLNKPLSEGDAKILIGRVRGAIRAWQAAADPDFKHALCLLILLKGQLRSE